MRHSSEIRNEIKNVRPELRLALVRHAAAKNQIEVFAELLNAQITSFRGAGEDLSNASNNVGTVVSTSESQICIRMAGLREIIAALEAGEELREAREVLQPLHAELAEAQAAEAETERMHLDARLAVEEAESAAREDLEAKIQSDPRVKKATQVFDAIDGKRQAAPAC